MRPDYVKCVLLGYAERASDGSQDERNLQAHDTWCGRQQPALEWAFIDANHAALNALQRGRLLICPTCAKAIADILLAGTESKET